MANNESKAINKKEKNSKDKTSFFKSFKAELKKVSWPTPKQLINNTTAVVVIVLILSAIVFVLDLAFESANKFGIEKVKEIVVTTDDTKAENTTNTETENTTNTETNNVEETTQETEQTTETTENNQ
ncbi:MAG: preprotein translocase subunit SecE [Clostridia bacterium]|nr:preprotein translocase subunit SecE [Clostridia bacterium]